MPRGDPNKLFLNYDSILVGPGGYPSSVEIEGEPHERVRDRWPDSLDRSVAGEDDRRGRHAAPRAEADARIRRAAIQQYCRLRVCTAWVFGPEDEGSDRA